MRCKSCDYPLWNLHARQCPECGAPFTPGDFEFVAQSVAFCCPHCDQTYYGTGECGHLEPTEFDCVTCGAHVHMDEMVLRPTEGLREQQTRTGDMPWLDRRRRGRIKAWFATIWLAMIYPAVLMRGVPESSPVGAAWWYAILTNVLLTVGRMLPVLCFVPLLFATGTPGNTGMSTGRLLGLIGGSTVLGAIALLVAIVVSLGLWGLLCHAALAATGATSGPMGRTFQAICYSSGANAITVVPCIGDFSFVWWIVSAVIMVKEGQRVSGLRATFAVLAFPILGFMLVFGLYAVFLGAMFNSVSSARMAAGTAVQQVEVQTLGQLVTAYAAARDGSPPAHALELVPANRSGTGIFISTSTQTSPDDVSVNEGTLRDFMDLGPNRQRDAARRAAEALPPNVVAHRVGDFVFTWHGINLNSADPGLWIAVMSPDPDANPAAGPEEATVALRADGTTLSIPAGELANLLGRQNRFRADFGLPPIPPPASVGGI